MFEFYILDYIYFIYIFFKIFLGNLIFIFDCDYFFNQSDKYIQTIGLYKVSTWLIITYYLIHHSLFYPICPIMVFLYHLSDHNYIIPLIKSRFFYSDYDWSISLLCPKVIQLYYLSVHDLSFLIFLNYFFTFFFFLSNYDWFSPSTIFSTCLIITTLIHFSDYLIFLP